MNFLDFGMNLLSLLQFCFLVYVFVYRERKKRFVSVIVNGEKKTFSYSDSDLKKERNEKSVLSSHGYRVKKGEKGWEA